MTTAEEEKTTSMTEGDGDDVAGVAPQQNNPFVRSNSLMRGELSNQPLKEPSSSSPSPSPSPTKNISTQVDTVDSLGKVKTAVASDGVDASSVESDIRQNETPPPMTRNENVSGGAAIMKSSSPALNMDLKTLEGSIKAKRKGTRSATAPGAVSVPGTSPPSSVTTPAQAAFSELETAVVAKGGKTPPRRTRGRPSSAASPGAVAVSPSSRGTSASQESTMRHMESRLGSKIQNRSPGAMRASGNRRQRGKGLPGLGIPVPRGAPNDSAATTVPETKDSEPPKSQVLKNDAPVRETSGPSMPSPVIPPVGGLSSTTQPDTAAPLRGSGTFPSIPQTQLRQETSADQTTAYPGVLFSARDVEAAEIQAVVVDDGAVAALTVAPLLSKEEEDALERSKFRRYVFIGVGCFVLVATAIIVPLVIWFGPGANDGPSPAAMASGSPSMTPSLAPTTDAFEQFLGLVADYSTNESLSDTSSPQYKAALWAANEDELRDSIHITRRLQRYFLACFYFATNGDRSWTRCNRDDLAACREGKPWLVRTDNECEWRGLDCDDEDRVVQVFFNIPVGETMGLEGQLPLELSYLTELTYMSVARNRLSGTIPSFLGDLTKLEQLRIGENQFRGTIPTELQKLSLLTRLGLNKNQLTGTIPAYLGEFEAMIEMELQENGLSGKIPSFLHVASSLDLSSNQFTGFVEEGPGWDTDLRVFRATNNRLDNTIWSQVASMTGLTVLRLQENDQLGGELPPDLFSLTALSFLDLSSCSLTGTIPTSISQLSSLANLFLDNNQLDGPIPLDSLETIVTSLRKVELHENNLTGQISNTSILCEYRGASTRNLSVLTVDCLGDEKEVECACCSDCF